MRQTIFLVLCCTVILSDSCYSICPACTSYGVTHEPSETTFANTYLKGYTLSSLFVHNASECFLSCIYDDCRCASTNYKTTPEANGTHLCELNYETKSSGNSSNLLLMSGFFFMDFITYTQNGVECSSCETGCCNPNPCLNNGTCVETCEDARRFKCNCTNFYTGRFCQENKTEPGFDLFFPNGVVNDFIMINITTIHVLQQFTVSLWMKSNDSTHPSGSLFSYYTAKGGDNTIGLMNIGTGLFILIMGYQDQTDVILNDGKWHHLVATWENTHGTWNIYKDGVNASHGSAVKIDSVIPWSGVLILGQDQDSVGGGFQEHQSYIGLLTKVSVWNRVLTVQEIEDLGKNWQSVHKGNVFKFSEDILQGKRGDVRVIRPSSS